MYDLEYQGTNFETEAVSWTSSMTLVTYGVKTTQCGSNTVLGGYNIMAGSSASLGSWYKTYSGLPAHNTMYFEGKFYMIDYWGYSSDHFHLVFDSYGTILWWIYSNYVYATADQWGNPAYNDLDPMMVYFTIPHTASSLTFSMANHFYSASTSDKQSVGFRDIIMTFATETTVPSFSYCGVTTGFPLPSNPCPCNAGETMVPANSGICVPCDSSCLTCNGAGRTMCTTCQSPLFLASGSCCDVSCSTCSGTGSTECTSCADDEYLSAGSCYPCDSSCLTCSEAGRTACASCQSPLVLIDGSCCDASCTTCSGTGPTDCTSCADDEYLTDGSCYPCDSSCLTCNAAGQTGCTTCQSSLVLIGSSCCDASCTTCSGTGSTDCTSCADDEYLSGGGCYLCDSSCVTCNAGMSSDCTSCADGEYLESGTCYACDSSCVTCDGAGSSACTSCDSLEFLVSGACVPCDSSCLTCSSDGPTICATCASKKYLSGTSCQDCDALCAECSDASNQCTSCVAGYFNYWNGSCLSTCPYPLQQTTDSTGASFCANPCGASANYLFYNQSCLSSCPSPLSVVANPGVQFCFSFCSSGYFLYENKTCMSSCLSPFVKRFEPNAQYCDHPCDPGIFWYKNASCLASCPTPYVQSTYSGVLQCLSPCPDSDYFYEYENKCNSKCEYPYSIKYEDVIKVCYSDVQISLAETTKVQSAAASIQSQGEMASGGIKAASALNSNSPSSALLAGLSAMLQYIRYMKITYPPKVQTLFLVSAGSPISLGFDFDIPTSVGKKLADNTLPDVFEKYDINSNFVYNLWDSMMTLLIVLVVIGVLSVLKFMVPEKRCPRISLALSKVLGAVRWNVPIMLVCSSSGDIFFYASLQIRSSPLNSLSAIICFCVSLLMMVVVFVILMIGFKILWAFREQTKNPNWADKWKGYEILYEEYEEGSIWSLSYMILFIIRGIIFNLTLANLFNFPLIQCIIINMANFLMLGYILYLRPLKNLLNLVQLFVNEGLINIIGVSIIILAIMDKAGINGQSTRVSIGDAIYLVIKVFNTFGLVFTGLGLLVFLVSLYKIWRRLKAQKISSPMEIFKAMIFGEAAKQESEQNITNDPLKSARIRKPPGKHSVHPTNQAQANEVICIDETEMSSRVQMVTDTSRSEVLPSMSSVNITPTPGFKYQGDASELQITELDIQPSYELTRGGFGTKEEDGSSFRVLQIASEKEEVTEAEKSIEIIRDYHKKRNRKILKIQMKSREPTANMSHHQDFSAHKSQVLEEKFEARATDVQVTKAQNDGFIQTWGKFKGYLKPSRAINISLGQEQEKEEVIEEKGEIRENPQNMAGFIQNWGRLKGRMKSKESLHQVEKSQIMEISEKKEVVEERTQTEDPEQNNSVGFIQDWGNLKGRVNGAKTVSNEKEDSSLLKEIIKLESRVRNNSRIKNLSSEKKKNNNEKIED